MTRIGKIALGSADTRHVYDRPEYRLKQLFRHFLIPWRLPFPMTWQVP